MTDAVPAPRRAAPFFLVLLAAAVLLLLWRIADYLLLAFIATLIAVYLASVMDFFGRRLRLPPGPALSLAVVLSLAALAGIGILIAPAVVEQTRDLITALPRYLTALDSRLRDLAASYPQLRGTGLAEGGVIEGALRQLGALVQGGIAPAATATGKVVIEGVAVMVMALYLAHRPTLYRDGIVALVPPARREVARAILADLNVTLRAWVGAQILTMVVLAVLTGIGLWLLDVPYWLAFAIFTGVAALVPFFGTLVTTILPALLVLGDRGLFPALAVALVGVVVHIIGSNVVQPLIMQQRVALPPVLTILGVMVMGELAGALGLVVAVPALAIVLVLVRHILVFRVYGEAPSGALPAVVPDLI